MTDTIEVSTTTEQCRHELPLSECEKCADAARKRAARGKARDKRVAASAQSEQVWWEHNRSKLEPRVLAELVAKDEYVRDLLFSMETITDIKLDEELLYVVRGFVETNGVSHLGAITKNDIAADWCTRKYWTEPTLLHKLTSENQQSESFVLYGLHSALPDWMVVQFLTKKAGYSWKDAAKLVGYRTMVRDGVTVMGYSAD
jgi:hypothetical protein